MEPAGRPTRILGYATGEVRGHEVELVVRVGGGGECAEDEDGRAEGKGRVARVVEQRYKPVEYTACDRLSGFFSMP